MKRPKRWFLLLIPPLAAGLMLVVSKPRSEVDELRERFPELTLAAHGKAGENEAWLFTGKASADDVARRLDGFLAKRPGWVIPDVAYGTAFPYGNHYSPMIAPRWFDRFAFLRIPDHRPVVDVHVMVGRAIRNDEERPHGAEWTTVDIQATPFHNGVSGGGTNPLEGWAIYR